MGQPLQPKQCAVTGPPLKKIPPQVPLTCGWGRRGGSRGGLPGARAALTSSGAQAPRRRPGEQSSGGCCERRATQAQRLARRSSRCDHVRGFGLPGFGLLEFRTAGCAGLDLSGGPGFQRPGFGRGRVTGGDDLAVRAGPEHSAGSGPSVSSSSGRRCRAAVKETQPAIPGHGNGPRPQRAGCAGLDTHSSRPRTART
jgi:hypothetical protein